MVSLKHIQEANRSRSSEPRTALFVGATSGIGLGAIEALLKSSKGSSIFIVGRSTSKFAPVISRLQTLDPTASVTFVKAQVSLLKEIDRVCATITKQRSSLDILWLSQGGLGLREGQGATSESLPVDFAVSYYGRVLFMHRLAPLLSKSSDGRVISILCAGYEGPINIADPGLRDDRNYAAAGFWGAQKQGLSMQSLAMWQLATEYPSVAFIHTNPGVVSTDVQAKWMATFTGLWAPVSWMMRVLMVPLKYFIAFTPEQAGEIGLFEVMEEMFSSRTGKNFFRLGDHAEEIVKDGSALLSKYRDDGTQQRIWEHTLGVFDEVAAG